MLPVVVLVGLHDAHAREAGVVEGPVVAAAPETVEPVDHHGVEIGEVVIGDAIDVAGELARWSVDLAAVEAAALAILLRSPITGVGSENTRKVLLSITPSMPSMLPIMSLLSTPTMSQPSSVATSRHVRPPNRPCSSPERPARDDAAAKR